MSQIVFLLCTLLLLASCTSTRHADTMSPSFSYRENEAYRAAQSGLQYSMSKVEIKDKNILLKGSTDKSPSLRATKDWITTHGNRSVDSPDSADYLFTLKDDYCGTNGIIKERWIVLLLFSWNTEKTLANTDCKFDLELESSSDKGKQIIQVNTKDSKTIKEHTYYYLLTYRLN